MTNGVVQIPPDSSGKKIDTSELTVSGNTVERQRIVIADPNGAANFASINLAGAVATQSADSDVQYQILGQLKRIALLLEIMTGQSVPLDIVL